MAAGLFGARGTYIDPATSAGVKGRAFSEYLRAHYASFPDARYKVLRVLNGRGGLLACEWRFRGINSGPMGESSSDPPGQRRRGRAAQPGGVDVNQGPPSARV